MEDTIMVNKQKLWFLTLFSLILILSVYYITMPSELLTTTTSLNDEKQKEVIVNTSELSSLDSLQVELDEERSNLALEYNTIITNKDSSVEDKNNAYEGLKNIEDLKAKEESLKSKIKKELSLDSFVKIENKDVNVIIKSEKHDYSLANKIMVLVQKEFKEKVYVSVKFQK